MSLVVLIALLQAGVPKAPGEDERAIERRGYEALVEHAVEEARLGRPQAAEEAFDRAIAQDPARPEAFAERGGLRFLEKSYAEAAHDLERALAVREDAYARELLAASLHLLGRTEEALASWNRLGGPRLRTVEITGLVHTREKVARREIVLREGERLDLERLRETRRRLEETGVFEKVTLRPEPRGDGSADLGVALLERHGLGPSVTALAAATAAQLADRRLGLRYANLFGHGASVGASWRFAEGRPELALGLDWPRPLGLDANVRLLARRGTQDYLFEEPVERKSRGLDVAFRRVLGARTTAEVGYSFRHRDFSAPTDSAPPGAVAGPLVGLERRLYEAHSQRLDATLRLFTAMKATGSDLSFTRGAAALRYERALGGDVERQSLAARVVFGAGTDGLPLDEAFLPGAGPESLFPLRGHRQFEEGVAGATPFGRSIVLGNMEWRRTLVLRGTFRLGAVAFYDVGRTWRGLTPSGTLHDVGVGLRIGLAGSIVRIDWGHGVVDGSNAVTLGLGHAF